MFFNMNLQFHNNNCVCCLYSLCYYQEPSVDHLREALQTLVAEQQDLSQRAAQSTLSLKRLNQRLVILERYFIALSQKGISSSVGEESKDKGVKEGEDEGDIDEAEDEEIKDGEKKFKELPESDVSVNTEVIKEVEAVKENKTVNVM